MKTKICKTCQIEKPISDFYTHLDKRTGTTYYQSHCKACSLAAAKQWKISNPERFKIAVRKNAKANYLASRNTVLTFLGGKCKCGFSDFRALQIDHKNGGGCAELKSLNWQNYHTKVLENPNDYQILCANCNWIKRHEKNENPKPRVTNRKG
jgi:hypothetical protein